VSGQPITYDYVVVVGSRGSHRRHDVQEIEPGGEAESDDALLDHMVAQPILINRPFVKTPLGTRLCRPAERVLDILPAPLGVPLPS